MRFHHLIKSISIIAQRLYFAFVEHLDKEKEVKSAWGKEDDLPLDFLFLLVHLPSTIDKIMKDSMYPSRQSLFIPTNHITYLSYSILVHPTITVDN